MGGGRGEERKGDGKEEREGGREAIYVRSNWTSRGRKRKGHGEKKREICGRCEEILMVERAKRE